VAKKDSRTDAELIEAARTGDTAAFEQIYYRHRDWVVRVAMRFTNNRDDALEALQDTFAYLLRKLPNLYLSARMTTFLYPVVKHCALTAGQKTRRLTLTDETTPEPAADPAPVEATRRSDLETALAGLPDEQRETLLLRFVDDMPLADIAAALDCPLGTVKSRIHNALQTLRHDPRARRFFEA
jgi:RNA polymerase sigma-70 factor (ECF subfamily)